MFRKMRRENRLMSDSDTRNLLQSGTYGVLALSGDDGYPYSVPINYVFDGERLYFHSASSGHKLDAIARCEKASFCVVENGGIIESEFTTRYKSVIVFGRIDTVSSAETKEYALRLMMQRLAPNTTRAEQDTELSRCQGVCVLAMDIDYMSGKVANQ